MGCLHTPLFQPCFSHGLAVCLHLKMLNEFWLAMPHSGSVCDLGLLVRCASVHGTQDRFFLWENHNRLYFASYGTLNLVYVSLVFVLS